MDCHARMDPPCQSCIDQIEGATDKTGQALREHIVSTATGQES